MVVIHIHISTINVFRRDGSFFALVLRLLLLPLRKVFVNDLLVTCDRATIEILLYTLISVMVHRLTKYLSNFRR